MEAAEILEQAKAGEEAPSDWIVLPLLRGKVMWGIVGWIFGIIMGFGLLVAVALIVIPYNYENGVLPAVLSTFFLGVLLFIGVGSAWSLIVDVQKLMHTDQHIIVITPEHFVKQEGDKVVHVPLAYVRYVTARGKKPIDRTAKKEHIPSAKENMLGFVIGRGLVPSGESWRRGRMRTPTSLAFLDTRTDTEVIVTNDNSFGDPFMIAAWLKEYAGKVQDLV
ncbi:MAG TPA: hypothetical protein VKV40_17150 [Ktedonobacteraceae bacterium]|nr:hypothetical protein [Ktedonobacteraceae bacterium]